MADRGSESAVEEVFYPAKRVAFVEWDEISGARPTVLAVGTVTVLSFVSGLSNLSQEGTPIDGPASAVVSLPPGIVEFAGVVFAFLLAPVVFGLQRRKRIAWRAAVVAVPALLLLPLTTFQPTDAPLAVAVLVTVPLLVRNRRQFDQRIELSPLQIASLSAIGGVGLYGTIGSYAIRDQFLELNTWSDAVYYVIVTVATVGYGDITPTTPQAQWFSLSVIVFGTGAFTVAVGALVGPVIESRLATAFGIMTASELTLLDDHVVVLGHGDVTGALLDEIGAETETVVVTDDQDTASALTNADTNVLTGDPTDESVLDDARVGTARGVVVGSNDDARDVLAVLAARNVAPDVRIVAAATEQKHVGKFETVGADRVVDLRSLGGRLLGRSVLGDGESDVGAVDDELLDGPDS
jgi:voltage-gated potassium channel